MPSAKDAARQIIEHLPDQATWYDIMYALYVKQKIEEGLADIEAGRCNYPAVDAAETSLPAQTAKVSIAGMALN